MADLDLREKHVSNGNLNVKETSEVTGCRVRQSLLKSEFRGVVGVRSKFARHARISGTRRDLGCVIIQCLGIPEVDFQILAGTNVRHVDGHNFGSDKQVLLVVAALVDGLCNVSANGSR